MKTIIALTDFSPVSLNAVNYAADLACSVNARLYLLHVFQLPLAYSEAPYPAESIDTLMQEAEDRMVQLNKELTLRTSGKTEVSYELRTGTVITQIEECCAEQDPYAIVMGTQGSSAAERVFFGSNVINAMRRLRYPLMIIPPGAKFTSIKKIALACDLKNVDDTIPFEGIKSLAKEFNAEFHLVHINTEGEENFSARILPESLSLQNALEKLHPVYHFLSNNDVENGLSRFTENNKIDLLIVVPKKHNMIDKLFHHSHSKKLVLQPSIPLMTIHE